MAELEVALDILKLEQASEHVEVGMDEKSKLVHLIRNTIVTSETCPGWVRYFTPLSTEELQNVLEQHTSYFEDFARHKDESESLLKYSSVSTLARRIIQAYALVTLKVFDPVDTVLGETEKLIEHCFHSKYFAEDYLHGFQFVLVSMKIISVIESTLKDGVDGVDVVTLQNFVEDLKYLDVFDKLSVRNKAGILAVKAHFVGKLMKNDCHQVQLDILQQVIEMDPSNSEWHLSSYLFQRMMRVATNPHTHNAPSRTEIKAILDAVNVQDEQGLLNPRLLTHQITCLAEILSCELRNREKRLQRSLEFGKHKFQSAEEVIQFIQTVADQIESLDDVSVRSNIELAKIFSSILPNDLRDNQRAKRCIERAIEFFPNSSKANHRMGLFYLANNKLPEALPFIKKAYETDQTNIYALLDLLRIQMGDVAQNEAELSSTFDAALNLEFFQRRSKNLSDILFTKAVYALMKGGSNDNEVVDLIVKAYSANEKTTDYFQDISWHVKRYHWNDSINGSSILGGIQKLLFNEYLQCMDTTRKAQLEKLSEATKRIMSKHSKTAVYSDRDRRNSDGWRAAPRGGSRSRNNSHNSEDGFGFGTSPNSNSDSWGPSGRGNRSGNGSGRGGFRGRGGGGSFGGHSRSNTYDEGIEDNWRK